MSAPGSRSFGLGRNPSHVQVGSTQHCGVGTRRDCASAVRITCAPTPTAKDKLTLMIRGLLACVLRWGLPQVPTLVIPENLQGVPHLCCNICLLVYFLSSLLAGTCRSCVPYQCHSSFCKGCWSHHWGARTLTGACREAASATVLSSVNT